MRFFRIIRWFLPMLFVVGCSQRYYLSHSELGVPSPWPYARGDAAATGSIPSGAFGGELDVVWERKFNDRPSGPLTIANGCLVYPGTKGKIRFMNVQTGALEGFIKAGGDPQTGVVVRDSLAFYGIGPRRNVFLCRNLLNGELLWERPVKDAVAGPIIVNDRLIIGSSDGIVYALNLLGGRPEWTYRSGTRFSAPASGAPDKLYQPANDGTLHVLSVDSGLELYCDTVDGPIVGSVVVDSLVYGADVEGNVYGLAPEDGAVVWRTRVEGPIWTAPAVARGCVYAGHSAGGVVALDAGTGSVRWVFDAGAVVRASVVVVGECVVFGTMTGELYSLNAVDGSVMDRRDLKAAIAVPPLSDGRNVYIATQAGRVFCLGSRDESVRAQNK